MPTLNLTHLHYNQLDPMTWCATAQVSESLCLCFEALKGKASWLLITHTPYIDFYEFNDLNWQYYASPITRSVPEIAHHQRQLQRKGVRLLLQKLLNKLEISDTLDESDYPYRLINSQYYVCFSHTGAHHKNDVRKNDVRKNFGQAMSKQPSSSVAVVISRHRPAGIDIENNNVKWRVAQRFYSPNEIAAIQSLPTIQRDSLAKLIWQIKESFIKIHQYTLAQGLGMDYAYLIADLVDGLKEPSAVVVVSDHLSHYHIAILPIQQTVVIF